MVGRVEIEFKVSKLKTVGDLACDISGLNHLSEYDITAILSLFGTSARIIQRRVLTHTHQHCSLLHVQILRQLAKVYLCSTAYTHCIITKVIFIKIHGYNLFLGVTSLELYCNNPFYRLLHHTLHLVLGCHLCIQQFGKLLGDCTATSGTLTSKQSSLYNRTQQGPSVNARVLRETHILGCNKRLYKIGRYFVILDISSVLFAIRPCSESLSIRRDNLRSEFI